MGITRLLPFLKPIQRDVHLSSFRGQTAAVDSYCWLHRGSYTCALQLVVGADKLESLPFIKYCVKRVNLLLSNGVTPIMVFDGGRLPTKAGTEADRRKRRQEYREKGKQLLKEGRKSEAVECFQKCVDVTPAMASALIKECRKLGVQCIVAPYEADAQLAYLVQEHIADLVITEDSDLLVFGAPKVLFKLDDSGQGKLIELDQVGKASKELVGFTQESFRQACILSGCDYLPSVPGVGLTRAIKLMKRAKKNPSQVIRMLECEGSKVPPDYEANFHKAESTFLYQLVFDPRTQTEVRLHPLPAGVDTIDLGFAGLEHSPRKAVNIARGNIDPMSSKVLDTFSPSKPVPTTKPLARSSVRAMDWSGATRTQSRLPIVVSERSMKPFKPPAKRKIVELEERDENEDVVTSSYFSEAPSGEHSADNEHSELQVVAKKRCRPSLGELDGKISPQPAVTPPTSTKNPFSIAKSSQATTSMFKHTPSDNPPSRPKNTLRLASKDITPTQPNLFKFAYTRKKQFGQ